MHWTETRFSAPLLESHVHSPDAMIFSSFIWFSFFSGIYLSILLNDVFLRNFLDYILFLNSVILF